MADTKMADTKTALSDVLVSAKMHLDEAVARLQSGEAPGALSPAALKKIHPDSGPYTNTGCPINDGCTIHPK